MLRKDLSDYIESKCVGKCPYAEACMEAVKGEDEICGSELAAYDCRFDPSIEFQ